MDGYSYSYSYSYGDDHHSDESDDYYHKRRKRDVEIIETRRGEHDRHLYGHRQTYRGGEHDTIIIDNGGRYKRKPKPFTDDNNGNNLGSKHLETAEVESTDEKILREERAVHSDETQIDFEKALKTMRTKREACFHHKRRKGTTAAPPPEDDGGDSDEGDGEEGDAELARLKTKRRRQKREAPVQGMTVDSIPMSSNASRENLMEKIKAELENMADKTGKALEKMVQFFKNLQEKETNVQEDVQKVQESFS